MEPLLYKVLALAILWALWRPALRGTTPREYLGCGVIAAAIWVVLRAVGEGPSVNPWDAGF